MLAVLVERSVPVEGGRCRQGAGVMCGRRAHVGQGNCDDRQQRICGVRCCRHSLPPAPLCSAIMCAAVCACAHQYALKL